MDIATIHFAVPVVSEIFTATGVLAEEFVFSGPNADYPNGILEVSQEKNGKWTELAIWTGVGSKGIWVLMPNGEGVKIAPGQKIDLTKGSLIRITYLSPEASGGIPAGMVNNAIEFLDLTTSEPATPAVGDKYFNTATGNTSVTGQPVVLNTIYTWNGTSWIGSSPLNENIALKVVIWGNNYMVIGTNVVAPAGTFAYQLKHDDVGGYRILDLESLFINETPANRESATIDIQYYDENAAGMVSFDTMDVPKAEFLKTAFAYIPIRKTRTGVISGSGNKEILGFTFTNKGVAPVTIQWKIIAERIQS